MSPKKHSYNLVLALTCFIYWQAYTQNLVKNFDFSQKSACPNTMSQLTLLSNWQDGLGTADYFDLCGVGYGGAPNHPWGYQWPYSDSGFVNFGYGESFKQTLSGIIQPNQSVYYEYHVVRGENGQYAVYNFGIRFKYNGTLVQQEIYQDTLVESTNWITISGCFIAPSAINEIEIGTITGITGKYLVDATKTFGQGYVYVDDVYVVPGFSLDLGNDTSICSSSSLVLDAGSPGATYLWNTAATTQTISVGTTGTYYVDVSQNGCTASDTINVSIGAGSLADLGPDTGLCKGGNIVLDAGNLGSDYLWSDGSTKQTLTIKDTMFVSGGYFSVKVSQGNCTDEDTIKVVFYEKPDVGMKDTAYCENELLVLDATYTGASSYLWNTGATSNTIDVTTQGQYTVAINNNGCIGYDTVKTYMIPVAKINLGEDTILCEGNTLTLNIGNLGTGYTWSTVETSTSVVISSAGEYWVEVQNSYCSSADTIHVSYQAYPVAGLGNDQHFCIGNTVTLSTDYSGALYTWSTGDSLSSITVDSTGDYWLIVDMNHCRDTDTVYVRRDPLPEFDLGKELSICPEEEIEVTANVTADAYYWNTGNYNSSITIREAGMYTVTVVDSNSCMFTDSIIFNDYCPTAFYVPSTFTPNGDQKNDVFIPKGSNVYTFSMYIYNRWGLLVFYTHDLDKGWDGTMDGKEAPEDTYSWQISYEGERENNLLMTKDMIGRVTLIR